MQVTSHWSTTFLYLFPTTTLIFAFKQELLKLTPQSATNGLLFFTYFVFSRAQSLSYFIDDSCDKTRIGKVMTKAIYMHPRAATRLWDPYDYNQAEMFQ